MPGRPLRLAAAPAAPASAEAASAEALAESVALSLLLRPAARRHFARLALAGAWAESIADAHAASPARDETLARHAADCAQIELALSEYLAAQGLRGRAADPVALAQAHCPVDKTAHPMLVNWF